MAEKKYAEGTSVPIEKTVAEILSTLKKYGCSSYAHAVERGTHRIMFEHRGYCFRMSIVPPSKDNFEIPTSSRKKVSGGVDKAYEDEHRRRARVLLIAVKAKLEMSSVGSSVDKEFMGDLILPSGRTVSEWGAEEFPKLSRGEEPSFTLMISGR